MLKGMELGGFLIDCHSPSETNLDIEIDCSHMSWDKYQSLIVELEDLLSSIDEAHSARSWLVKGRSLKARYRRVSQDERRRRLRFSPFPSKFWNMLTNARGQVYNLVNLSCVVLEEVGMRKVYLLPKAIAPGFVEAIDLLNKTVAEPLRKGIDEFRKGKEYFAIETCLHKYGVDPSILQEAVFSVGRFRVDVTPVDFSYSIDEDAYYQKVRWEHAMRGLELLSKQIEQKYREYSMSAVKDMIDRLTALSEKYDSLGVVQAGFKKKWRKLTDLCDSLGMKELVENFLEPVCETLDQEKAERAQWIVDTFGTNSLSDATKKYLSQTLFLEEKNE